MGLSWRRKTSDRRTSARIDGGDALRAYFWDGGVSGGRLVRNISEGGAYVENAAEWSAGTILHVVLEHRCEEDGSSVSSGVWAEILRLDDAGMALIFLFRKAEERENLRGLINRVAGKPTAGKKKRLFRFRSAAGGGS